MTSAILLSLCNVYGERLSENANVTLNHRSSQRSYQASIPRGLGSVAELVSGIYSVRIKTDSYMPVGIFASTGQEYDLTLALRASKAKPQLPKYEALALDVQGRIGQLKYDSLSDLQKAGLLNVFAKCRVSGVLPFIESVYSVEQDRVLCRVFEALTNFAEAGVVADQYTSVSGALHHPPKGFEFTKSYKSDDRYGNLQLTFFKNDAELLCDIDIDDANGLGHVFQVSRNYLTGRPTHPFDIHQILLKHQHLDTGYRLAPVPVGVLA